jgi:hypothetical protein
VVVTAYAW